MKPLFLKTRAFVVISLLLVAGCGSITPYVFGTIERNVVSDGVVVPIADQVQVCYNSETAKPRDVIALAERECAKTKRQARFVKQDILACPVFLPANC